MEYRKVDIYCDESRPDLLSSNNRGSNKYILIGGLKLRRDDRDDLKEKIRTLKDKYAVYGELKWTKVSFSKLNFYKELIDLFFSYGNDLRFRCIVIDSSVINLELYHDDDAELGFYKFYYQLLNHWLLEGNCYQIFTDNKTNRKKNRLGTLKSTLIISNIFSKIYDIQAIPSKESVIMQLTDILLGAASAKFNNSLQVGSAKWEFLNFIEDRLQRQISPTNKDEMKFNVFKINLRNW